MISKTTFPHNGALKILFLNKFFFLKGGSEKVFFEEMSLLKEKGHEIIPFSRRHPKNIYTEYSKFFANELCLNKGFSYRSIKQPIEIIYSFNTKKCLRNLLIDMELDIAHAHNIYGVLTTSVLDELYNKGIPTVLTLHDYKIICPNYQFLRNSKICEDCKTHRFYNAIRHRCVHDNFLYSSIYALENTFNSFTKKYLKKVSRFIAVSKFIKNKFIEYGFPKERLVYIPNYINTDNISPGYGNQNYFLYVGRLSKEKGVETLIEAFNQIKTKNFKLVIVGEGPLTKDIVKKINDLNMDGVELTGFLTGKLLEEKIKNCTCVVVPSESYENAPMVILESFAYGKPVVGANIGGIPELIADETAGLTFESGSVEDLAKKLDYIACLSPKKLMQMGKHGRNKIEKYYNAELHYNALISLYDSLLKYEC